MKPVPENAKPGNKPLPGAAGEQAKPEIKQQPMTATKPMPQQTDGKAGASPAPKAGEEAKKPAPSGQPAATGQKAGGATGAKTGQSRQAPQINTEQKTKITQTIRQSVNVRPVTNINVSINVGVAVPRTVELNPLPPEVFAIVPEYEGYRFFETPDAIVIVDPETFEIVYVIPL